MPGVTQQSPNLSSIFTLSHPPTQYHLRPQARLQRPFLCWHGRWLRAGQRYLNGLLTQPASAANDNH